MAPTPVFLPGKVHGWKSPVGYSPWSHKESDTTERLSTSLLLENGKWMDRLWLLLIHLNLFKDLIIWPCFTGRTWIIIHTYIWSNWGSKRLWLTYSHAAHQLTNKPAFLMLTGVPVLSDHSFPPLSLMITHRCWESIPLDAERETGTPRRSPSHSSLKSNWENKAFHLF